MAAQGDVETTAERIIPTDNYVTSIHPNIPSVDKYLQLDGSIDHKHTMDIHHEPTDLSTKGPIEFIIHPTPGTYVDMQSFVVDVKLQVTKADQSRGNIGDWKTYFINNLTQSLWQTTKVYLNDTCIQSNYNNQQIGNLTHILTTSNVLLDERGVVQGAFKVTDQTLVDAIDNDHVAKDDIVKRINFAKQDTVHIRGNLHLDMTTCEKYLLDAVRIKVVLEPASVAYILKSVPGDEPYDYTMKSVTLTCTKIKPSDGTLIATTKKLLAKPFEYVMRRAIVHKEVIPSGYNDFVITRPFQDLIPNKMYIVFVDREGAQGVQGRLPYYYNHCNLNHYSVRINGIQIAGGTTDENYITQYLESMRAHGGEYFIPYDNYTKGSFVLCVNTNDQSEYNSINIEKKGNLSIGLSFKTALPRSMVAHVFGVIDSVFECDSDRNITTHYQY